ncbi:MAG: hypothetical protein LBI01_05845 [Elusimicrobium sp.]|nr:hypothetical protein [Elusimicrobium sp.]
MKKIILFTIICAAVFLGCKKQESTPAQSVEKKDVVSAELRTAFDTYKKIVKAQRGYFDKNHTVATFKQLNIEVPGGAIKPCITLPQKDNYTQCVITDKYEFYLRGVKNTGYTIFLTPLDKSFYMSDFGSQKIRNPYIYCSAPMTKDGNICEFLGGKRDPSGDMGNLIAYNISLE